MSDFDAFLSSLSDEQKEALMKGLMADSTPSENKGEKLPQREEATYKPKARTAVVNEDFSVTPADNPKGHRTPVKAKTNQWADTGENRDEEFDASKYEEIGRAPRIRQAPEIVDVECHVCKKMFTANVSTLYGTFHRCGRCVGR